MRGAYPQYRDSGVEWLGDVPAHWDVTVVKRNYQVTLGKMLQGDPIDRDDVETPYLKALHVQWAGLQIDDAPTMWVNPGEIRHLSLTDGDLLVCEGGEGGRSCLLTAGFERYIIQNSLHRVRPRGDDSNAYLCYVLSCISDRGWFAVLSYRATIAHFTREKFASLMIPIPPADEQRAIAAFLDRETARVDKLVDKNRLLIERLAEYRTAMITRAVTRGLDPSAPLKPSGVEWLGDLPEHWEACRLGSMGSFFKSSGGTKEDEVDEGLPCVRYGDIYTQYKFFIRQTRSCINAESAERYSSIRHGDLLFAGSGETLEEIGKSAVNLMTGSVFCAGDVIVFRPKTDIDPTFLGFAADCSTSIYQKALMGRGVTVMHIYSSELKKLFIVLPPLAEQRAIADYLDYETERIDALTAKSQDAIERLQEYRAALITAAVTGKIDVREPEQVP